MLGTIDPDLSARFARNYSTAAFGYARAASAAYVALATQVLDFWATAAKRIEPSPPPPFSPYLVGRPRPPEPLPVPTAFDYFKAVNPWFNADAPAMSSIKAWWSMFPLEGNPSSWPMAYSMMTAGVPRDVAMPAAEANVAVFEAADVAKKALDRVFASYQTEGGHASSHIVAPTDLVGKMWLTPMSAAFTWSWLPPKN